MRKKLPTLALACFLALILPLSASAHPGKTDSSGGHTDHSTGEYHYHHGYPAHQHYDMDGDGVADCPYDFVDKTGQNSGSSSSGSGSSSSKEATVAAEETTIKKSKKQNTSFFDSFWWPLILFLSITWGPFVLYFTLTK